MEVRRAVIGKGLGLRGGIVAIDGGAIHIALRQAHDLAALEIDRRIDGQRHQGRHFRKRARKASP